MSNLKTYAIDELTRIGMYGSGDEMNDAMCEHIIKMVDVFAEEGHSGFSAEYAISILQKLLRFEPLSPLTGEDDEWNEVGTGGFTMTENEMKMTETIQQLKEDIAILQEKLQKLEEQDPEMLLLRQGKVDFVDYDRKKYIRIEYTDSFAGEYSWYVRRIGEDAIRPVRDVNVYASLEELYQKEVVKQKDDYPYKIADEHGETNPYKQGLNMIKKDKKTEELMTSKGYEKNSAGFWEPKPQNENEVAEGLKSAFREAAKQGVVSSVDEPKESWMDKPIDKLVDMLEKNPPKCLEFQLGKTLEQLIERWWCDVFTSKKYDWDMETAIQDLCDRIFLWLPKEQDSSGTQRIETIVAVDTHNELLRKIKSKLRNTK